MSESSERFFDQQSRTYSDAIERCVPRYREMLRSLLNAVPPDHAVHHIVELGCGTGHLTQELLHRWPRARVVAVDLSAEALEVARKRLGPEARVEWRRCSMESLAWEPASVDLVVSSIAIHHLVDAHKARLFTRVHEGLRSHGLFVFADQFAGATSHLDQEHKREWRRLARQAGLEESEWQAWQDHEARHDHHATLAWHLEALTTAGFGLLDCVWRHLLWVVLISRSQGGEAPTSDARTRR